MKHLSNILLIGIVLLAGIEMGLIIKGTQLKAVFTTFIPALSTLFAAFFGAKYTFHMQFKKEQELKKDVNIANGNLAIFGITFMANDLFNFQQQFIEPFCDDPFAFYAMGPAIVSPTPDVPMAIKDLSFLLESEHRNILGEAFVAQQQYTNILAAIKDRSALHIDKIQPLIEAKGIVGYRDRTLSDFEDALGPRLFVIMQKSTQEIIQTVDSAIESLRHIGDKLTGALRDIYPSAPIIDGSIPGFDKGPSRE